MKTRVKDYLTQAGSHQLDASTSAAERKNGG